jgi:hypothetical protein
MDDWNENHFYTPLQKVYFLVCGIIVALTVAYITHLYFEYRVVNATWETTFVSPAAFWEEVPEWKWQPIFVE